jgi:diphthamide biosynthesis protein 3
MGAYYDEVEIEDMSWDDVKKVFHYPCPCGDRFEISRAQLANYEDIAPCPSCSLVIRVVYDPVCEVLHRPACGSLRSIVQLDFEDDAEDEDEESDGSEQTVGDEAAEAIEKLSLVELAEVA